MSKDDNRHYTEGSLPARFDSWISRVLDNLAFTVVRSYYRKTKNAREILMGDIEDMAVADPFAEEDLYKILLGETPLKIRNKKLAKGLSQLSPRKQQVIEGTIVLGIPVSLLADMLGLDDQIVSNYKYVGLKMLRKIMEEDDSEQEEEE